MLWHKLQQHPCQYQWDFCICQHLFCSTSLEQMSVSEVCRLPSPRCIVQLFPSLLSRIKTFLGSHLHPFISKHHVQSTHGTSVVTALFLHHKQRSRKLQVSKDHFSSTFGFVIMDFSKFPIRIFLMGSAWSSFMRTLFTFGEITDVSQLF